MSKLTIFLLLVVTMGIIYGVVSWGESIESNNTEVTVGFYNDSFEDEKSWDLKKLNTDTNNIFNLSKINRSNDKNIYISIAIENTDNIPKCFLGDIELAEPELDDFINNNHMFSDFTKKGHYYHYVYSFSIDEMIKFNSFSVKLNENEYSYSYQFK